MNGKFDLQKAKEAIIAEHEDVALRLLDPLAHQGNADAQFLYGVLTRSLDWICKAADHPEACYFLACANPTDNGFDFHAPVDENGWALLHKAAELDSIAAQTDLGRFYMEGASGLIQDDEKGFYWLYHVVENRRSANQEALYYLGHFLLDGIGIQQDISRGTDLLMECVMGYGKPAKSVYMLQSAQRLFEGETKGKLLDSIQLTLDAHKRIVLLPRWKYVLHRYLYTSIVYPLKNIDFDTFVEFLFDHLVFYPSGMDDRERFDWTHNCRTEFDNLEFLQCYIRLFHDPSFLLNRFTLEQINYGFWNLITGQDWSINSLLRNSRLPLKLRIQVIREMGNLFEHLFSKMSSQSPSASFMWWDGVYVPLKASGSRYGVRQKEYQQLQDTILETLTRILAFDSLDCKYAALHGLGHLRHPGKVPVLEKFLENPPDEDFREYAEACITGDIM